MDESDLPLPSENNSDKAIEEQNADSLPEYDPKKAIGKQDASLFLALAVAAKAKIPPRQNVDLLYRFVDLTLDQNNQDEKVDSLLQEKPDAGHLDISKVYWQSRHRAKYKEFVAQLIMLIRKINILMKEEIFYKRCRNGIVLTTIGNQPKEMLFRPTN